MLLSNIISAKKAIIFYIGLFTWFLLNSSSRKKEVTSRDHSMAKFAQIFKTYGFELPYYLLTKPKRQNLNLTRSILRLLSC